MAYSYNYTHYNTDNNPVPSPRSGDGNGNGNGNEPGAPQQPPSAATPEAVIPPSAPSPSHQYSYPSSSSSYPSYDAAYQREHVAQRPAPEVPAYHPNYPLPSSSSSSSPAAGIPPVYNNGHDRPAMDADNKNNHDAPPQPQPHQQHGGHGNDVPDAAEEEIICRICHEGAAEGVLISPCVCRGSMKYVHRECLDRWRRSSANPRSVWECDQCKYKYSFRRSQAARWISSKWALHAVTLVAFFTIIFLSGFLWKIWELIWYPEHERTYLNFWDIDLVHFTFGSIIVGIGGFFSLIGGVGGVFRGGYHGYWGLGGRGRSSSGSGGNKDGCGQAIIVIIVVIGLARALWSLYGLVKRWSHIALAHAEYMVENVNAPDEPRRPMPRPRDLDDDQHANHNNGAQNELRRRNTPVAAA